MKIRVRKNIWTTVAWWDQIANTASGVLLKKKIEGESDINFVLAKLRSKEQMEDLFDLIHIAALNNDNIFDVEKWLNRSKKSKSSIKSAEK